MHRDELGALEDKARSITRVLGAHAGVRVDAVVAVPRIPKTTSGKVQRFELAQQYNAGELKVLRQESDALVVGQMSHLEDEETALVQVDVAPSSNLTTQDQLLALCKQHIEGMQISVEDNLFDLGISSLTLAEIHAGIDETWPDQVEITDLFDYPTVAELAQFLDSKN